MSGHRQVSHPRHQRPTLALGEEPRQFRKKERTTTDRGWGGAGAVGWGVLGAFGSLEKDTAAQVVRKNTDSNVKMVKNEKGLWVKVRAEEGGGGAGRGRGIPVLGGGGGGESSVGGLQDYSGKDDRAYASSDEEESPPRHNQKRRSSRSRSRSRSRRRHRSPSDSRSPSRSRRKERQRRHSRSRSRSRDRKDRRRSRSRSPRRSDHKSSRRSRSRSRERDRRRERRSRSASRSPPRHRGSDERRKSPPPQSRKRSPSPPRKGEAESAAAPPASAPAPMEVIDELPPVMVFTAAQLADRLVEVYNLDAKNRLTQMMKCFDPSVTLCNLKTGADVLKGADALRDSMPSDYAKWNADCSRRLYMEASGDNPELPTFCLDFYPAGHAPGMNAMGKGGVKLPTVLLYRVRDNRIDRVWIAPEKEDLATSESVKEARVLSSKVYASVAEVVKKELGGGDITHVFSDYRNIEVWG